MGGIITKVTDAVGLTDSKAGERAAKASTNAANIQAQYQREALDYLKQQEELPTEIREAALPALAASFGLPGYEGGIDLSRESAVQAAQQSPLYQALLGGQAAGEESILRNAAATGGLRSGNIQSALADFSTNLQNQALLQSYDEQQRLNQQQLGGLQSLAGLSSYAPQIAQQTSAIGQTLGQGQVAAGQARATGAQQDIGNLLGAAQLGGSLYSSGALSALGSGISSAVGGIASFFSDKKLKKNIKLIGTENGYKKYSWDWNDKANDLGLAGNAYGVIADDIELTNPEAVGMRDGYKTVNYEMIGVSHG